MPTPVYIKCHCGESMTLESGKLGEPCRFICPQGHTTPFKPRYTGRFAPADVPSAEIKGPSHCPRCQRPINQPTVPFSVIDCRCGARIEYQSDGSWKDTTDDDSAL